MRIQKLILPLLIIYACAGARAQEVPSTRAEVLKSIARNNVTLRKELQKVSAARNANAAGLVLPDPEAEVAYLIGTPDGVPNRTNVSLMQSLDWGVVTGRRRAVASAADSVAVWTYDAAVAEVVAEADQKLCTLVYLNRLCAELQERETLAAELSRLYARKLDEGDANALEASKARLNASVAKSERQRAESDRQAARDELVALNGGQPLAFADTAYAFSFSELPALEVMLRSVGDAPAVRAAEAELQRTKAETRLAKTAAWPTLNVGFQGEYIEENNYSGLALGFTLPVWGGGRRKVRAAEAEAAVAALDVADVRFQREQALSAQYALAQRLDQSAQALRADLAAARDAHLLRRALDEGHISLLDYLLELSFYYSARTALLEAERDAHAAAAQCRALSAVR